MLEVALGFVFIAAGALKLAAPARAAAFVSSFGVQQGLARRGVILLAVVEIGLGAVTAAGWAPVPAAVGCSLLLVIITSVSILGRMRSAPACGCFGVVDGDQGGFVLLWRAGALLCAAVAVLAIELSKPGNTVALSSHRAFGVWGLGLICAATFLLTFALAQRAVALLESASSHPA